MRGGKEREKYNWEEIGGGGGALRVQGEILGELFGIFMRVECLMLNKAVAMWKAKLEMPHFEHRRDSHSRVNEGRNFKTLFNIINDNPFSKRRELFEFIFKSWNMFAKKRSGGGDGSLVGLSLNYFSPLHGI